MARAELRHLEHFIAVAEERNFTRAARRLHLVQSALSVSIRSLERELGIRLFERTTREVELTDAGHVLLPEARRTLEAAVSGQAQAGLAVLTLGSGPVLLGCPPGHPLARRDAVAVSELASEPFVDLGTGLGTRTAADHLFALAGVERSIGIEVSDASIHAALVRAGSRASHPPGVDDRDDRPGRGTVAARHHLQHRVRGPRRPAAVRGYPGVRRPGRD